MRCSRRHRKHENSELSPGNGVAGSGFYKFEIGAEDALDLYIDVDEAAGGGPMVGGLIGDGDNQRAQRTVS